MPAAGPSPRSFDQVFAEGRLSLGVVLPVRRQPDAPIDFREQIALARRAEELGFAAIWVRDVPLNGPWYPEIIGHLDPWVALGAVSAVTRSIALGTAATVLPLRHPWHLAKAAASVQALSGQRLLLGLGSGDRPEEFAAFGLRSEDRRTLFREKWEKLQGALLHPQSLPGLPDSFELRPTDFVPPPLIVIGSAGQSLEWIARHAAGWATYHREPEQQRDRHHLWRRAVDGAAPGQFRSFSVALHLSIERGSGAATAIPLGYRTGETGLVSILAEQRDLGVHHLMLNLESSTLEPDESLELVAAAAARATGTSS
ncbi:TIGR03571 family LLM class oxidoreductase [Pseudoroseomonas wenyumeiae]|uniref:TIGR03571 family LLM class oxidoreductase n=1 Tax=Teichococcus wenyumeiae TaxID=2478470 RepID=A0A3A9JAS3_9PROT|nr:TIGR03571 family LLM class oxidoreductase [Pseudoroseomonas wenyumeiae]RMI15379.1 TIGR03571 family LLM class oxidoreductase [Pseudoroseomonas wenyumeiae]